MSKAEAVSGQFGPRCDSADGLWSFKNGRRNTLAHAGGPGVQGCRSETAKLEIPNQLFILAERFRVCRVVGFDTGGL
jgi:hypothetical protein